MTEKERRPFRKIQENVSMPSFGEYLRRERELREISLREISDETKVTYRYLEALEQDNESRLPAEVFTKGIIRSYAQYVGIDPDEALLRYQEYQKSRELTRAQQQRPETEVPLAPVSPRNRFLWLWVVLALLLVGAAVYYGIQKWQEAETPKEDRFKVGFEEVFPGPSKEEKEAVKTPETAPAPAVVPAPPAVTPEPKATTAPEEKVSPPTPPEPMVITLTATDRTWLAVDVDGKKDYDVTLQKGENLRISMVEEMRLNIGNAGGLLIRYKEQTIGPLGKEGQVKKNVLFTRKDFTGEPPGEPSQE
jgi:cytoskeleton protein RodZ